MKNLPRALKWFIAIVISMVCLIGTQWLFLEIAFNPESGGFILRAMTLGGIIVCLAVSYIYIVKRNENKTRVRQVYAIISLLVVSAYVFSEYQTRQNEMAIRDICTRFDQAVAREDYETADEFMLPDYRQTHSLAEFKRDPRWFTCAPYMRISILHPVAGKASISQGGSLRYVYFLEKLDHQWYFTGEYSLYQG